MFIFRPNIQNAGDVCSPGTVKCDPNDIYYSLNGSCNNLDIPFWAQVKIPFVRLLPANYSDGNCAFRKSVDGSPLPSPRIMRTKLLKNKEILDDKINNLFYCFGQWLDHDVTHSLDIPSDVSCCNGIKEASQVPEDICMPIIIPPNDPFYSKFGVTCLDAKRSINTNTVGCKMKPCSQINFATGFIDMSILYGQDEDTANELRSHEKGQLKFKKDEITSNQMYPPILYGSKNCPEGGLTPVGSNASCFHVPDERVHINPEITAIQIVTLRLHNYLGENLYKINPHWSDERLYQEARRILIALYQHVIFAEHVPLLIGPEMTARFKLFPASSGYVNGYNNRVNPQTLHSFEAGVGRLPHSMIKGKVTYLNVNTKPDTYLLRNLYSNYSRLFLGKNMFLNIISSYNEQQCASQDKHFTEEVNNWLFYSALDKKYGLDLSAVDIQRGRDHGLSSYNEYRQACGLCRLKTFDDMKNEIKDPEDVEILKTLYKSVDDIDLYVGSILEKSLPNALVGPTAACIQGESFFRWKVGDRLFYEFPEAKFKRDQLATIRDISFAQMLCIAVPELEFVPKHSFLVSSPQNPPVRCDEMNKIKLEHWKE